VDDLGRGGARPPTGRPETNLFCPFLSVSGLRHPPRLDHNIFRVLDFLRAIRSGRLLTGGGGCLPNGRGTTGESKKSVFAKTSLMDDLFSLYPP